MSAAASPNKAVTQAHAATNMVKLIAMVAELEALMLLAMTFPMRLVMRSVQSRAHRRMGIVKMVDDMIATSGDYPRTCKLVSLILRISR